MTEQPQPPNPYEQPTAPEYTPPVPPPLPKPAPLVSIGGRDTKRRPFPVELWGQRYTLTPPKAALAMKWTREARSRGEDPNSTGAMMTAIDSWMDKAFGREVADTIRARMDDDGDDLDIDDVVELMEKVTEHVSGNPTGSSSGSPRRR